MNNMRHDTIAFGIGAGIHMGDKTDGGSVGIGGRQSSHDIAVAIHYSISQTNGLTFFYQKISKDKLLLRTGNRGRILIGGCGLFDIC